MELTAREPLEAYTLNQAKKLGLAHWTITLTVQDDLKVEEEECCGACSWATERHTCIIYVDSELTDDEKRATIRHELVHLRLEGHRTHDPETYDPMYEFGINKLVEAWS